MEYLLKSIEESRINWVFRFQKWVYLAK